MNLENITTKTRAWKQNLDIVIPIDWRDIPNFKQWVNWNGWKGYSENHDAVDFGCYLNKEGDCILGLPEKTPVRVIADGYIIQVSYGLTESLGYAEFIYIEHSEKGGDLFSAYHHVVSKFKGGEKVKKGDIIATLYKDDGVSKGRLVHLHFELTNGWDYSNVRRRAINPEEIYPSIGNSPRANPQGSKDFRLEGLKEQPRIVIANFNKLLVNNY